MYPLMIAFISGVILGPLVKGIFKLTAKTALKGTVATYDAAASIIDAGIQEVSALSAEAQQEVDRIKAEMRETTAKYEKAKGKKQV